MPTTGSVCELRSLQQSLARSPGWGQQVAVEATAEASVGGAAPTAPAGPAESSLPGSLYHSQTASLASLASGSQLGSMATVAAAADAGAEDADDRRVQRGGGAGRGPRRWPPSITPALPAAGCRPTPRPTPTHQRRTSDAPCIAVTGPP